LVKNAIKSQIKGCVKCLYHLSPSWYPVTQEHQLLQRRALPIYFTNSEFKDFSEPSLPIPGPSKAWNIKEKFQDFMQHGNQLLTSTGTWHKMPFKNTHNLLNLMLHNNKW